MPAAVPRLSREIGLRSATAIVVGTAIGSGIFIGADRIAAGAGSVAGLVGIWVGLGALSFVGALVYAEFGAAFPRSGGDYAYLRVAVSPFWGFLAGWLTFVASPSGTAALAVAATTQAQRVGLLPEAIGPERFLANALLIVGLGALNYFGVRVGARVQLALTVLKLALVATLIGAAFLIEPSGATHSEHPAPAAGLAVALLGAMWAFEGWTAIARVAGEVASPERTIPRSLLAGLGCVILTYVLVSLAYVHVLGLAGMAGTSGDPDSDRLVASRFASALAGAEGERWVAVLVLVSVLGALNGSILTAPRVYYAMARDGLFPSAFARVHPRHRTPHVATLAEVGLALAFASFFTFEQLVAYMVILAWLKYALVAVALARLRRRHPEVPRPFRMPGPTWLPLVFAAISVALVVYVVAATVRTQADGWALATNAVLVAVGAVAYVLLLWWRPPVSVPATP